MPRPKSVKSLFAVLAFLAAQNAGPALAQNGDLSALTPIQSNGLDRNAACRNFDPIARYGNELVFQIRRNDAPVGQHTVRFNRGQDGLQVVAQSNIDISFLGFNAYSFRYRSESIWQDGQLSSLSVKVDDDGDQSSVTARREKGQLVVDGPDGQKSLPPGIFPTDHWHCGVLQTDQVLNTLTGNPNDVTISQTGREQLAVGDGVINATHFTYDGELKTNAWYDADGRWVGLRFKARDGSEITYRCTSCQTDAAQKDSRG